MAAKAKQANTPTSPRFPSTQFRCNDPQTTEDILIVSDIDASLWRIDPKAGTMRRVRLEAPKKARARK